LQLILHRSQSLLLETRLLILHELNQQVVHKQDHLPHALADSSDLGVGLVYG
jgi:hypothetical protein